MSLGSLRDSRYRLSLFPLYPVHPAYSVQSLAPGHARTATEKINRARHRKQMWGTNIVCDLAKPFLLPLNPGAESIERTIIRSKIELTAAG